MIERRFGISLKPLTKAGTPQRTQTFALFICFKKFLLSKQNLAYNITHTSHFGSIIHIYSTMSKHSTSSIKVHHSHHDRHSRLVPHDRREYITHGTRCDSCRTLSNCCCHPHLSLRACDIYHICWSHLLHPLPVLHLFLSSSSSSEWSSC